MGLDFVVGQREILTYEIRSVKQDLIHKLDNMERMILMLLDKADVKSLNSTYNIQANFPVKSKEDMKNLDDRINNDISFRKELEKYLFRFVGEEGLHKNVYNILKKVFSPYLTPQYSAMGKGGKVSFTTLNIYIVIKDVLHRRFPNVADQDILKSIVRFFVTAKDRIKGKKI
ncbi:hypothetical protein FQA39_LY16077 [Lamprigera yunnana]|nr:hypothetical protein FQA39_LY16077 [Lamprigera yunnana]